MIAAGINLDDWWAPLDLWGRERGKLRARPAGHVRIRKVKGHATVGDVMAGRVAAVDKARNDAADWLAKAGAKRHADNQKLYDTLSEACRTTRRAQLMMLEIREARRARTMAGQKAESERHEAA